MAKTTHIGSSFFSENDPQRPTWFSRFLNLVLSFLARLSHTSLLPSKATLLFLTPRSPGRDCNQIAVMARTQPIPRRRGGKSKQTGGNKKAAPNKGAPDKVAHKKAAPKRGGGGGEGRPQQVRATAAWISSSLLRIEPQPDSSCDVQAHGHARGGSAATRRAQGSSLSPVTRNGSFAQFHGLCVMLGWMGAARSLMAHPLRLCFACSGRAVMFCSPCG